ncbi:MAG: leucine-rich repeat domain-containing protein, partial [Clostridiales bacterium]|nr:leucine-rich repeat domain-containing protein [Clostridiales bacterium]
KIAENKYKGGMHPVVYGYYPAPFDSYKDYVTTRALSARYPALLQKLDRIEEARAETATPPVPYDAPIFCDASKRAQAQAFADALGKQGFTAFVTEEKSADVALLRGAGAAYAFFGDSKSAQEWLLGGAARDFVWLENGSGVAKRPVKIVCDEPLPALIVSGYADCAQFVPEISAGAEARRLRAVRGGGLRLSLPLRKVTPLCLKERAAYGETEEAGAQAAWKAFLAQARASDGAAFAADPRAEAFTPEALGYACEALDYAGSYERAKPYIDALVNAAMRCIDRKAAPFALRALDVAFTFDPSDFYAQKLLDRLHAACGFMRSADCFAVCKKVLDKLSPACGETQLGYALRVIDDALRFGEWECADDCIEGTADKFPAERALYLRKLLCENRVPDMPALQAVAYPRFTENFAYYLALSKEGEREKILRNAFDALVRAAQKSGFAAREEAIDGLLALGQVRGVFERDVFCGDDYRAAGDIALAEKAFDAAQSYYTGATVRASGDPLAWWGLLLATRKCENDRALIADERPVESDDGLYAHAFSAAYGRDERFLRRIERVKEEQSNARRKDGHVFIRADFIVRGGTLVRYTGRGTARVYVEGGITAIGDGAFRGTDAQSVSAAASVVEIGDGAFAYSDVRNITFAGDIKRMGANPFAGCEALQTVAAAGNVRVQDGCVYCGARLVAFVPQMHDGGEIRAAANTATVGAQAFYKVRGARIDLGSAACEPCALYGCEGTHCRMRPSRVRAATGEGALGASVLAGERIAASGKTRWSGLYGDGGNNMAAEGDAIGDGKVQIAKIADCPKPSGGILVKNDTAICCADDTMYALSLSDGACARFLLDDASAGTGVLWNEYVIQPVGQNETTLCYIDPRGKTQFRVPLSMRLTRPLCLCGDDVLCIGGDRIAAVHLPTGKVCERIADERIASVPCATENGWVIAGEQNVYALDRRLQGGAVHALAGGNYAVGQGKICRGRIVAYNGSAYWFERNTANVCLGIYNGTQVGLQPVPRRIADILQTQPVFYNGTLYAGGNRAVITAPVLSATATWNFTAAQPVAGKYAELAVIGGVCYLNLMEGEYGRLRLRALADGKAILTDMENGGIYAARV